MMVNNLMHLPIEPRASKTKDIIGFQDLRFGVREWYWLPCCAPTFLQIGYLVQSGHSAKCVSTQVGHLILSERFGQTEIDNGAYTYVIV